MDSFQYCKRRGEDGNLICESSKLVFIFLCAAALVPSVENVWTLSAAKGIRLAEKELQIVGNVVRHHLGWMELTMENCGYTLMMPKAKLTFQTFFFFYNNE